MQVGGEVLLAEDDLLAAHARRCRRTGRAAARRRSRRAKSIRSISDSTSGVRGSSPERHLPALPHAGEPAGADHRHDGRGRGRVRGRPGRPWPAAGVTPTCSQAERDRVPGLRRDRLRRRDGRGREAGEVGVRADPRRSARRTRSAPAPSQALPPMAVAARWNARLGMPELVCTPPLSSVVST